MSKINKEKTYGELNFTGLEKFYLILKTHEEINKHKTFIDIGSGYGILIRFLSDYLRMKYIGIELDRERHIIAKNVTWYSKHKQINFLCGNILNNLNLIDKSDIIFINNLFFLKETMSKILDKINTQSLYVMYLKNIEREFEILHKYNVGTSWSGYALYKIKLK